MSAFQIVSIYMEGEEEEEELTKISPYGWINNINKCIHGTAASPDCWFKFHNLFSILIWN